MITSSPVSQRIGSGTVLSSVSLRAFRRGYKIFKDGVDPDTLENVLYSSLLLTSAEHEKAIQPTATDTQKLQDILKALERRIRTDPNNFNILLKCLMEEPALEGVAKKLQGEK